MAYATPRTWVAGAVLTAAQLNQDVRDNISFLANPPSCRVYRTTDQAIVSNTITPITFNAERWDTNTMHDTSTNTNRITFNTAGLYIVTAAYAWAANATGVREEWIEINNSGFRLVDNMLLGATVTYGHRGHLSTVYKFAVNDYIELRVFQDCGVNLNIQTLDRYSPEVTATWIGLG